MASLYKKVIEKLKTYQYNHINVRLLIWVYALCILGINVISSARPGEGFDKKQIFGLCLGTVILITMALIDYHFLLKFYWLMYFFNLALLLAVKLWGVNVKGAKRWIDLSFVQLQPSELTKILMILILATIIGKYQHRINSFKIISYILVVFAIPLILILDQPDLSTSLVICAVFCIIMYIGGISYKIIAGVASVGIIAVGLLIYLIMQPDQQILKTYQMDRIMGFLNSEDEAINYQQDNSLIAIGSGGLWGKGLHNDSEDSVKNGNYISEPQTDFIFTIVGEELGFVGSISVVILLALICFECFYMGAHAPDIIGKIICCGIGGLIAIQSFINLGVVTKLLPNTGLPLPFVSYGLSSLVSLFIGLGVVFNVGLQYKKLL